MGNASFNLLTEPLIRTASNAGKRRALSLPEVLAELGAGTITSFEAVQAHQRHAWYAFLVQLAAIALDRAGTAQVKQPATTWRDWLRSLAGGDEAWCLIVEDLNKPAFMQPPIPEGTLKNDDWAGPLDSPDDRAIDLLVTTRAHDVKPGRGKHAQADTWVFALTTLQTMQGYSGGHGKLRGIARMNKGLGSRPCVTLATSTGWGSRYVRDLSILLGPPGRIGSGRANLANAPALLWLLPWSGRTDESLSLEQLNPFFIEVCRRVRLVRSKEGFAAWHRPTEGSRIAAEEAKGNTGDPWTPIAKKDGAALTVSSAGFDYKRSRNLLFEADYALPATALVRSDDPEDMIAIMDVLVRGQGETGGYHRRVIPIPARVRIRLATAEGRATLGRRARLFVEMADTARSKVLRMALCALLQGGPAKLKLRDPEPSPYPWLRRFDRDVDAVFFDELWKANDLDDEGANRAWGATLRERAWSQLQAAIDAAPVSLARTYRAIAAAEGKFNGLWRRERNLGGWSVSDEPTDSGYEGRDAG